MATYTIDAMRIFEALLKHQRGETGPPYGHFLAGNDPNAIIGVGWPNGRRCIDLRSYLLDRIETFE